MKHTATTAALGAAACLAMGLARAQNPSPLDIRACSAIETDAQRLACYDKAVGRPNLVTAQKKGNPEASRDLASFEAAHRDVEGTGAIGEGVVAPVSLLDSRWELSPESKLGTMNLRGYKPTYALPVFASSDQNQRPSSPAPNHTVSQDQGLDSVEAKFQLSLKTKAWQGVFGDVGDLWVGYTQSSRWQVYNKDLSRPFRETDYEPEALLAFDTHYQVLGWEGRLLTIGVNHQSNGRADPLSRSWNRVVADVGFERPGWVVMLRPWWRIPEDRKTDDNPDISDYMGRGEVQVIREWNSNEFGLTARHSFRAGDRSHGSLRFTWSFPLVGNVRGYLEAFNGYGESLIDYNHSANYLGLGVSLLDWY